MFPSRIFDIPELRDLDRLFERMLRERPFVQVRAFPPVNVREEPERLVVEAALPGYDPSRIDVKVEEDTLVLSGERRDPEGARVLRRERWSGPFVREIALPFKVDSDHVEARYANGILTIELPKAPEARPRKIQVQVGGGGTEESR